MPVRTLSRQQTWLMPPSLEQLLPEGHAARFVAAVVDNLPESEWAEMGVDLDGELMGAPSYHPRLLLSMWLYGFMTGTRSSRKLEVACREQVPCYWLTGWQQPDHNTLWRFYKEHRDQMRRLFRLTVKTAVKMDLLDTTMQAVDGTKIAANANKRRTYDKAELEMLLVRTDKLIQALEEENAKGEASSPIYRPKKQKQAEDLQSQVKRAMKLLAEEERKSINLTDGDTNLMKSHQGIIAAYNVEAMVSPLKSEVSSKKRVFMTAVDATQHPSDNHQLIPMMDQAKETTEVVAGQTLADAGFCSGANLVACEDRKQVIIMPGSQERQLRKPYHKDKFIYDAKTDSYLCPFGQTLGFKKTKYMRNAIMRIYRGSPAACRRCAAFGECTKSKYGRELQIGEHEAALRRHRQWMETEEAKKAYKKRMEMVEAPFGILKEVMGLRRFLLRGLANVRAEATMVAAALNLRTLYALWQSWSSEQREKLVTVLRELGCTANCNRLTG
jgi:transposase